MRHSRKDHETLVEFSFFWTPVAMLATALLMIAAVVAIPVVFLVTQLTLPRSVKPLRDA